jgi:hypothetical protein
MKGRKLESWVSVSGVGEGDLDNAWCGKKEEKRGGDAPALPKRVDLADGSPRKIGLSGLVDGGSAGLVEAYDLAGRRRAHCRRFVCSGKRWGQRYDGWLMNSNGWRCGGKY